MKRLLTIAAAGLLAVCTQALALADGHGAKI
jgi:hypothetical protein